MSTARSASPGVRARSLSRTLALVAGAAFLLVGIAGFFVTGFGDFAEHTDKTLLGFEVNPLHNVVHVVVGLAGLVMSSQVGTARTFGWLLFVGYGATFILGLIVADEPDRNFLSLNTADNVLHILSVLLGLVIALAPSRERDDVHLAAHPRRAGARTDGAGR
jgi:hypothetical protein